jgi:hypothetical protein
MINNQHHISQSLETIFLGSILQFFDADPGWKQFGSEMEKNRIRDKHPGSATMLLSQHLGEVKAQNQCSRSRSYGASRIWIHK